MRKNRPKFFELVPCEDRVVFADFYYGDEGIRPLSIKHFPKYFPNSLLQGVSVNVEGPEFFDTLLYLQTKAGILDSK